MTLLVRSPLLVRLRRRGRALLSVARTYALGTYRVLAMFAKHPELLPLALRAPLVFRRHRARPTSALAPLMRVADGIWRVPQPPGAPDPLDDNHPRCVVLHYTGTGESVHSAYENTQHLFAAEPCLASTAHYIFEAPLQKGAYYGPEPFSAAVWERVEPIVAHYEGPFVLVGVSRGAMVALDHGMRIVEECGKVASVLSLSAPLDMPARIPVSIRTIADFVDVLVRFSDVWSDLVRPVQRWLAFVITDIYVMLTALILRHHSVYDVAALSRNARDLTDHGVVPGSLRASREFRLLLRTTERELSLFRQLLVRALLRHRGRLFVRLVWGRDDVWVDADRCAARMAEVAREHGQQTELALASAVLDGFGHLVSPRDEALYAAHRAQLSAVARCALTASLESVPEIDPTLCLRSSPSVSPREDSDD